MEKCQDAQKKFISPDFALKATKKVNFGVSPDNDRQSDGKSDLFKPKMGKLCTAS